MWGKLLKKLGLVLFYFGKVCVTHSWAMERLADFSRLVKVICLRRKKNFPLLSIMKKKKFFGGKKKLCPLNPKFIGTFSVVRKNQWIPWTYGNLHKRTFFHIFQIGWAHFVSTCKNDSINFVGFEKFGTHRFFFFFSFNSKKQPLQSIIYVSFLRNELPRANTEKLTSLCRALQAVVFQLHYETCQWGELPHTHTARIFKISNKST